VRSSSNTKPGRLAGEELIKYNGWQVRSSSNTMLAGEELFKIKCRYSRWGALEVQGQAGVKLINHKSWKAKIS
jgi:hypothetical protein